MCKMSEQIDYERRRFFEATALYVAASQLGMSGRQSHTGDRKTETTARDQAGNEYVIRFAETDQCWPAQHRIG
jgi:hypothetical protein